MVVPLLLTQQHITVLFMQQHVLIMFIVQGGVEEMVNVLLTINVTVMLIIQVTFVKIL